MSLSIIDLAELNTIRLIHPDRVVVVTHKHSFDSYPRALLWSEANIRQE